MSREPQAPVPLTAAAGPVVALGGDVRADSPLWARVVGLAGGPGARFAVLTAASGRPVRLASWTCEVLRRAGARTEHIAVGRAIEGQVVEEAIEDPEWIERVLGCDAVFFTGGSQAKFIDTLRPQGRTSGLLQAALTVHRRGGLLVGTSAGAALLSRIMFRDAPDLRGALQGRLRQGQEVDHGLDLLPASCFVDQHFFTRGRVARMVPLMLVHGFPWGVGVEEDSGAVFHPDGVETIGNRGLLVVDLRQALADRSEGAWGVQGALVHLLQAGDRFRWGTASLVATVPEQALPATQGTGWGKVDDILGHSVFPRALVDLCRQPWRGLTAVVPPDHEEPEEHDPDLSFEMTLTRTTQSRWWPRDQGWYGGSVGSVRLDIRARRMP